MSRTQIQQGVVVILLAAFGTLWILSRQGTSSRPAFNPQPGDSATPPLSSPASSETPASPTPAPEISRDLFLPPALLQERISAKVKSAQNPPPAVTPGEGSAATPAAPKINLSQFELQGIFWGTAPPQAIINRQIVSVGDRINGAQVVSISKDRVQLEMNGAQVDLKPLNKVMDNPEHTTYDLGGRKID